MNILFYLTPKCDCAYLEENDTLRMALEKMEARRYSAIPLLTRRGHYIGTITEGDLLWYIKNKMDLDLHGAERINISTIRRHKDYTPINIRETMEGLMDLALQQNFVPVLDDNDNFIGIVTRQEIMRYIRKQRDDLLRSSETEYRAAVGK